MPVSVRRLPIKLEPDPTRVITRYFCPGDLKRAREIIERVLTFPTEEIDKSLAALEQSFSASHPDLSEIFEEHFQQVHAAIPVDSKLTQTQRSFIGACFTMEYAIESVALFNPSIVPALIQEGVPAGGIRFVMSLRAIGEGHLSSIVFRTGVIDAGGDIRLEAPPASTKALKAILADHFHKSVFERDLAALGIAEEQFRPILEPLPALFTREQLSQAIEAVRQNQETSGFLEATADSLIALTRVNYQLRLEQLLINSQSEIVIFPFSDIERHGIEDLRMVRFTEDDGSHISYGTFTAFNGERIFPQLMEFRGKNTIEISLITGDSARNKGMALFPRRVHGKYAMISRIDNENLYFMESDDIRYWDRQVRSRHPSIPGRSSRSVIAGRRSKPRRDGCCLPTESDRCASIASARCCSTTMILAVS